MQTGAQAAEKSSPLELVLPDHESHIQILVKGSQFLSDERFLNSTHTQILIPKGHITMEGGTI